jgi:ATP phosphoribosyltransferase regulatory subunit
MNDALPASPALLPAGLHDKLPPEAEAEARSVAAVLEVFAGYGYQLIEAPLLEFEDSLFAGSGQELADQAFRVMDPHSHRMMALRADITPQVARIATTRLGRAPRPLRLSYAGACLRVAAAQISPERQVSQAGIELIGPDSPEADAEVIALCAEALGTIGLSRVSFDLTMPRLAAGLIEGSDLAAADRLKVARALDRKDAAEVRAHAGALAPVLESLLLSAGRPDRALGALAAASLPPGVAELADRLAATVAAVDRRSPGLTLTVDPVESRGFRYHTGACVTVFAPGRHEELGRGGRYLCGGEPATGVTLYSDAVLRAAPVRAARPVVFVPAGTEAPASQALRDQGMATVMGLEAVADAAAEARRLGCGFVLENGTMRQLDSGAQKQAMPDRAMPDRAMPDRAMPDWAMPGRSGTGR